MLWFNITNNLVINNHYFRGVKMDRKNIRELKEIYNERGKSVEDKIAARLRNGCVMSEQTIIAAAYVLMRANDPAVNAASVESLCESIGADDNRLAFLACHLENAWPSLLLLRYEFENDELISVVMFTDVRARFDRPIGSPSESVASLAGELLNVAKAREVTDLFYSSSAFLAKTLEKNPGIRFKGFSMGESIAEVGRIKAEIFGGTANIEIKTALNIKPEEGKFDLAFCSCPAGLRLRNFEVDNDSVVWDVIGNNEPEEKSASRVTDLLFVRVLADRLSENGTGAAILISSAVSGIRDLPMRRALILDGCVKAIISLPKNTMFGTQVSPTILLLGHNNEKTMVVDASEIYTSDRRTNYLTDEQIFRITRSAKEESEISRLVPKDEFAKNEYDFTAIRYIMKPVEVENGVKLASVIGSIGRGFQFKADVLDKIISETPTKYRYLTAANIQDGFIDDNMQFIKIEEPDMEKYCIKDGSLVISKFGSSLNAAVINIKPGEMVFASDNVLVVELDRSKANPYFIKAFLDSAKGRAQFDLLSAIKNRLITFLSIKDIESIVVPNQDKFADEYRDRLLEIEIYERHLREAKENLKRFYDTVEG